MEIVSSEFETTFIRSVRKRFVAVINYKYLESFSFEKMGVREAFSNIDFKLSANTFIF